MGICSVKRGTERSSDIDAAHDPPAALIRRLTRAEGQVRGVRQMLLDGRDCGDVLTQLAAARKALDQIGFLLVAERLTQCVADPDGTSDDGHDLHDLRRLFLRLA